MLRESVWDFVCSSCSENQLLSLLASLIFIVGKVDCKLGKDRVKLILFAGDHIEDAKTRDTTYATCERQELQLELDRLETLYLTWNLRVAAADKYFVPMISVLAYREL